MTTIINPHAGGKPCGNCGAPLALIGQPLCAKCANKLAAALAKDNQILQRQVSEACQLATQWRQTAVFHAQAPEYEFPWEAVARIRNERAAASKSGQSGKSAD